MLSILLKFVLQILRELNMITERSLDQALEKKIKEQCKNKIIIKTRKLVTYEII